MENVSQNMPQDRLAVAGFMSNLNISTDAVKDIQASLAGCIVISDFVVMLFLGWILVPMVEMSYNSGLRDPSKKPFRETYLFHAAENVSQMVKIVLIVYITDINDIIFDGLGFEFARNFNLGATVGKVAFTIWGARRIKKLKRYVLSKAVDKAPNKLGKYALYDHLSDVFVYASAAMFICDILSVEVGTGLTSVFAFGSMGTFAFSLASKDLCAQLLSSLAISTSDKFLVGDSIKLGDGTSGVVDKIGWFDTTIRGYDNISIKIPNAQLSNQRVSNLSKVVMCQIKQNLYFAHNDVKKIPKLLEAIKAEIKEECPHLISDGKRPFRAVWSSFVDDRLEILVECHFNLPPSGNEYWANRQNMLMAIATAMEKSSVTQALPSSGVRQLTD